MAKGSQAEVQVFAGIDVSARELSVGVRRGVEDGIAVTTFTNNAAGHKALLAHLLRGNARARVCLEASGNYSLDLALTLQAHPQVEISVVNPRRARRFAESLGERSKTDPVDARVLCEYAMRMRWVPWVPPSLAALRLRGITRAIEDLVAMQTQEKNRQHSLLASRALPALVIRELEQHLRYLQLRITRLRREALRRIARHPELNRRFHLMLTTPGIGDTSALIKVATCSRPAWRRFSAPQNSAAYCLTSAASRRCWRIKRQSWSRSLGSPLPLAGWGGSFRTFASG